MEDCVRIDLHEGVADVRLMLSPLYPRNGRSYLRPLVLARRSGIAPAADKSAAAAG